MYLTLSKRFEFAASARMHNSRLSPEANADYYGAAAGNRYGIGNNYTAYFVFHGPVDESLGMMINVSIIKERMSALLQGRYDHKFLNVDTVPFEEIPPTPENVARMLLLEAMPFFSDTAAKPVALHLEVSPLSSVTAYADGRFERNFWVEFSAARRTCSPHLSDAENQKLFGIASSPMGHGHNYRLRVTVEGRVEPEMGLLVPYRERCAALDQLKQMLDHKSLNDEVPLLKGWPITTESLAKFCFDQLSSHMPMSQVRLHETSWFFAEYQKDRSTTVGVERMFHAAHRLNNPNLSAQANRELYGKCNNPSGHGHLYRVQSTIGGPLDERSGTLADLNWVYNGLGDTISPWAFKHLDAEVADFAEKTSTGENIVSILWPKLDATYNGRLQRLRLWETPNNRFTLRRSI
ncbi:MAG: 6-carboxytetrahydropterin synthase [bacterium]|nr:6-carboxytetrahydropterin synthase [bacterium]